MLQVAEAHELVGILAFLNNAQLGVIVQDCLLKGFYRGILQGTTMGVIKGNTRSLDYSSPLVLRVSAYWEAGKLYCSIQGQPSPLDSLP